MSRLHITCLISILCWLTLSLHASDNLPLSSVGTPFAERTFHQAEFIDFQWNSFALRADSGSLVHDLSVSFALLPHGGEHRMPSYMVNVTGDNAEAFRLLPNGVHFTEPATIAVPYDDFLLPMGYKPKDIKTFYFDEDLAQWKELERVSVDTANHVVISYTTHFTDFANAVIKLPEVPEMKAFVPTAMQDLPDVNPLQGIPMVAAPTANNRGTAELTYPIELPAGRNGMQPNIDLHYSSAGGNDILGVGWSIAQPAITIDTRWGVPRYDDLLETEAYLLNGEQIVLHNDDGEPYPLPHQAKDAGFALRKYGRVEYYARDTKNQDRIVRKGTQLSNFHWEVTDRNGITSFYGYDPITHAINENAIVRTAKSSIAYWALTATVDLFGNYVRYFYHKDNNEVYLDRIEYTGNLQNNTAPVHKIWINYQSTIRPDVITNGRLGVLQKKKYRIDCITISSGLIHLAQYRMLYDCINESLYKSRLESVSKYDEPACITCCAYENPESPEDKWSELASFFQRPDEVPPGLVQEVIDRGMTQEEADSIYNKLDAGITIPVDEGTTTTFQYQNAQPLNSLFESSAYTVNFPKSFSRSSNKSWNIGGSATVGFGEDIVFSSKSVGANYNYSRGEGSISSMMMDIDGDGLPDLLCQEDTNVYYYKQHVNGSFTSEANRIKIQGINSLSREISDSHTFGVQADFVANFSYNPTISKTYTDIFFSDVNGDGLPDLITPEGVKFNHLENGVPSFIPLSVTDESEVNNSRCGAVLSLNGEVDERLECENIWVKETSLLWRNCLVVESVGQQDTPIDVSKNPKRPQFTLADNIPTTEGQESSFYNRFHLEPITENDYEDTPPNPGTPDTYGDTTSVTYTVNINPDWLSSDYHVQVVGDSLIVYHLETICNDSSDLPDVDIVRVWVAPRDGTINLASRIHLKQDTTYSRRMSRKVDGVKYYVQRNELQQNNSYSASILDSGRIVANRTDTVQIVYNAISVQENDVFFFRLSANEDRKYDNTEWVQTIEYSSGNPALYNSANDYVCTGQNNFVAPCAGTAQVGYTYTNNQNTPFNVVVKKNGTPLSSLQPYSVSLTAGDSISFYAVCDPNNEPIWSNVHIHPYVKFIASSTASGFERISDTLRYFPDIHVMCSSVINDGTNPLRQLFGPLHKGWGQFAYNNKDHDEIIDVGNLQNADSALLAQFRSDSARIKVQFSSIDTTAMRTQIVQGSLGAITDTIDSINKFNPLENGNYWIAMRADSKSETWLAYGNLGAIGQKLHSTSVQIDSTMVHLNLDVNYDSAIPISDARDGKVKTIRKESFSVQHCLSAGVGPLSENFSFGTYDVEMDYMDMNGDGFPDFISKTTAQYSTPWGGIGSIDTLPSRLGHNKTISVGMGFSRSKNTWGKMTSNGVGRLNVYNASIGFGINGSHTDNSGEFLRIDINADGLPDLVSKEKDSVWYNLGYSYAPSETLHAFSINDGHSSAQSASVSGGLDALLLKNLGEITNVLDGTQTLQDFLSNKTDFSFFQFSLSGGVSHSVSDNISTSRLTDIDGDGYPDILYCNGNSTSVRLLRNGAFVYTPQYVNLSHSLSSKTGNMGVNLGVTAGFTLGVFPVKLCFGVQTSPWSGSVSQTHSELMDMNGDGFVDYIQEVTGLDGNTTHLSVYYNQNGLTPVNMLTSVTNPTGQIIELNYEQTSPSVEQRGRTWRLSSVKDSILAQDGTAALLYSFSYHNPYHDNYERIDLGYDTIITIDNATKRYVETYSNAYFISRGDKLSDLLTDTLGHPYIRHSHQTRYVDLEDHTVTSPLCNDASIRVAYDYYQTDYFEGESSPVITTRYELIYDQFHNIIRRKDYGDIAYSGDDWVQNITYHHPEQNRWCHNLISLPINESVTDGGNNLRESSAYYNIFGRPEWIIHNNDYVGEFSDTYFGYDNYGCLVEMAMPENHRGLDDRGWFKYQYDDLTHSLPSWIYNQHLNQQFMLYQEHLKPWMIIDPSGNGIEYQYDAAGRLFDVVSPHDNLTNDLPYTMRYCYRIPGHEKPCDRGDTFTHPYILKVGISDGILSAEGTIYDARGHEIQKKHLATVRDTIRWVTDGVKKFDPFYHPLKVSLPFVSNLPVGDWDSIPARPDSMHFEYDVMDRIVRAKNFDGSSRLYTYTFGLDIDNTDRLKTIVRDENHNVSSVLKSPQDWTIQTTTPDSFITFYEYNPIGELIEVIDADDYHTSYKYDNLGNCVERNHPDAGITRWTYTPSGNVETVQTNVHINNNQYISYDYDLGRLMNIAYSVYPENSITYEYDYSGRIRRRTDGTGYESFTYDRLGNKISSYKHITIPSESYAYNFRTFFAYDPFGRIHRIVYPDGDVVLYKYYGTGELRSVTHHPSSYYGDTLVSRLRYNEYGQRIYQRYGNAIESNYGYEPKRQWLANKRTGIAPGHEFQDLIYSYDSVGNILGIDQLAYDYYGLGGMYNNTYQYDRQNRLIGAYENSSLDFLFNFSMSYSPAGRLGHNSCGANIVDKKLRYGYDDALLTHQPRVVYDSIAQTSFQLFWDANGNLAQIQNCALGNARHHFWNEENQLQAAIGPQSAGIYGYDGDGNRVWKLTGDCRLESQNGGEQEYSAYLDDAVLYPNPYITISLKGYTKHFYIEQERISTVLGEGGWSNAVVNRDSHDMDIYYAFPLHWDNIPCETYSIPQNEDIVGDDPKELQYVCKPTCIESIYLENLKSDFFLNCISSYQQASGHKETIYFTHDDHLGSASWITDAHGDPIQYIHYAPYGELLASQHAYGSSYDERYKFTGKERDAETGYDYFGARFLAQQLGIWLSVDPLVDKYLGISPYAYCAWNPIKYLDPDGRDAVLITFPNYRAMYRGHKIPHTGHSGVLLINNKTGMTKYYEYGRYGSEIGRARNVRVPNVIIKDGRPTNESLNNVLKTISKTSGDNGDINGAYVKSDEFEAMQTYAEGVVSEASNPNRTSYDIFTNNCATFAEDVITQDESVKKPTIFIHTPVNTVEEYQEEGHAKVYYNSKTQETSWSDEKK